MTQFVDRGVESPPDSTPGKIAELEEALQKAEEASRNKSAFIAGLSHEIRTPLNSIIGVTNLFQGTKLDLEQRKFVEMLSSSAQDLLVLVQELLDLSLIETGRLTFRKEPFPIRSLCSRAIRPMAVAMQERRLSLELQVDPAVPEFLRGDGPRLSQILRNMVENALSLTAKGNISVWVTADNETESTTSLYVTVSHGHGANFVGDGFPSTSQGSGMGLLIAKGTAEAMGGALETEVIPSGDRLIHFHSPMELVRPEEIDDKEKRGTPWESAGGKISLPEELSLLVVDDNRFNRSLAATVLRKMGGPGWKVSQAEGGGQALARLEETFFDIIFMDVQMPEMDGLEATRLIRKREETAEKHSLIIAMTAYAMEGDRQMCLDAGMDDYIAKPVEADQLLKVITKNLTQH